MRDDRAVRLRAPPSESRGRGAMRAGRASLPISAERFSNNRPHAYQNGVVEPHVAAQVQPPLVFPRDTDAQAVEKLGRGELHSVDGGHIDERPPPAWSPAPGKPEVHAFERDAAGAVDGQHPEIR